MTDEPRYPDEEEVEHTGDHHPAASGGGLTRATGNLTPDAFGTEPFVPGELREIEDPTRAGRLTEALARHAQLRDDVVGNEGEERAGPTVIGPRGEDTDTYGREEEHF